MLSFTSRAVLAACAAATLGGCIDIDELSRYYDGAISQDLSANLQPDLAEGELGGPEAGLPFDLGVATGCTVDNQATWGLVTPASSVTLTSILGNGQFFVATTAGATSEYEYYNANDGSLKNKGALFSCSGNCKLARLAKIKNASIGYLSFAQAGDTSLNFASYVPSSGLVTAYAPTDCGVTITSTDVLATATKQLAIASVPTTAFLTDGTNAVSSSQSGLTETRLVATSSPFAVASNGAGLSLYGLNDTGPSFSAPTLIGAKLSGVGVDAQASNILIAGADAAGHLRLYLYTGSAASEIGLPTFVDVAATAASPIGVAAGTQKFLVVYEKKGGGVAGLSLPIATPDAAHATAFDIPGGGSAPQAAYDPATNSFAVTFTRLDPVTMLVYQGVANRVLCN